jgi:hypothetical protein
MKARRQARGRSLVIVTFSLFHKLKIDRWIEEAKNHALFLLPTIIILTRGEFGASDIEYMRGERD